MTDLSKVHTCHRSTQRLPVHRRLDAQVIENFASTKRQYALLVGAHGP